MLVQNIITTCFLSVLLNFSHEKNRLCLVCFLLGWSEIQRNSHFFQEERGVQNTPNESMSVSVAKRRWPLSDRHRPCYRGNVPPKDFFTQCPSSEPGSWWRGPSQRTPLSSMQGSGSFLNKNTYMLFLSGILNHLTLIILLFSSSAQSAISRFIPFYREKCVLTVTWVACEQFSPDYGQKKFLR